MNSVYDAYLAIASGIVLIAVCLAYMLKRKTRYLRLAALMIPFASIGTISTVVHYEQLALVPVVAGFLSGCALGMLIVVSIVAQGGNTLAGIVLRRYLHCE